MNDYSKTCLNCACDSVCDHNVNGWEHCGNWISVDAVPVVRGEWRIAERYMSKRTVLVECSECYALLELPMTAFGLNYNYCPNCGAKMQEETNAPEE